MIKRKKKLQAKDKVLLCVMQSFKTPVYRHVDNKLVGPLTRTFKSGAEIKAVKMGETNGSLNISLGKGYVAFNIPIDRVFIAR